MRVWASLGLMFALVRTGFTPGQLSHFTPVSFSNTLGPSVLMGVPSGFRVLVAEAPRTRKPSLMVCTC